MNKSVGPWAIAISCFVVACGTSSEPELSEPPPSEPVVFAASSETKAAAGIVTWGYANDEGAGTSVFRGYGARHELVVEYRRTIDDSDPNAVHVVATMTSEKAAGRQQIDFTLGKKLDDRRTEIDMTVVEDTFGDGTLGAQLVALLARDAEASEAASAASLLDDSADRLVSPSGDDLVTRCNVTIRCQTELVEKRVADASGREICSGKNLLVKPAVKTTGIAIATGGTGTLFGAIGSLAWPVAKCYRAVQRGKAADAAYAACAKAVKSDSACKK